MLGVSMQCFFFFFNDTATTEIYTLSLHDALPISLISYSLGGAFSATLNPISIKVGLLTALEVTSNAVKSPTLIEIGLRVDRKSTRLNSSHGYISYAVFCLKKKKKI